MDTSAPVHLFRLAGIYGPGRSALDTVRSGRARRVVKPGQVFSRTHVDGRMLLQGVQRGLGWSMAINAEDGTMTLTGALPGTGFVVSGACTPAGPGAAGRSFK